MLKRFLQCLGLASILLVANYGDLLGGGGEVRMHVPFRLAGIVLAQVTDILLLALALFLVATVASRLRGRPRAALRLVTAVLLPLALFQRVNLSFYLALGTSSLVVVALLWTAVVVLVAAIAPRLYARAFAAADALGIFLAVFAVAGIAQLLWLVRWRPGATRQASARPAVAAAAPEPRQHPLLVWIVLDELSFDQVFAHRAAGLALPHFDALRSESTLYTDVQPAGRRTAKILPSLLGGRLVTDVRYSFNNRLFVHYDGEPGWHAFTGDNTLFRQARQDGWRTAVVGWYNPYCPVYGGTIDDCYWTNLDMLDGPMVADAGFWHNVATPLKILLKEIYAPAEAGQDSCSLEVQERTRTFIDLRAHALALLARDGDDFVLLHMPVPHSPNIWDRSTGTFATHCGRSYLDSLSLADRLLGEFLADLQRSPRWNETTVIVQGDHSWRTFLWDGLPSWTAEARAASHNRFDPRPALLIHAAGQTAPATEGRPWPLLQVHQVVESVLAEAKPAGK